MTEKKVSTKAINLILIAISILVTVPLLVMGHYNYPSADDWSFGAATHKTIEDGGNLFEVLGTAFAVAMEWREKGEPRYANAFLGALQPGIWGEHFYRITPWIMIGSLFLSEILLCRYLLKDDEGKNKRWILPVALPTLMIQMMCVPFPVETFYWYTGAVNYTFIFSLSLIQLMVFLKLKQGGMSRVSTALLITGGCILSVFVGGDSYAASLSAVCTFGALSLIMLVRDRKALLRTLPLTLMTSAGLMICLAAPGNQVRLDTEFGGSTTGAFHAILMSLERTALNIYSWTGMKILVMALLVLPFLWKALRNVTYTFRYPAAFTVFTFGIYASQIVATMYVDGSTGGRRMAAILYYAYHVWVMLNAGYWIGWVQRRKRLEGVRVIERAKEWVGGHLLVWFAAAGVLLAVVIGVTEIRQTSTYRACAWLFKGYAREYADAWEERLVILKDDSVKEVYFDPLPGYEELVFYADFQPGENWVNNACEVYYEKDYIGLK